MTRPPSRTRRWLLGIALLATLAATFWVSGPDNGNSGTNSSNRGSNDETRPSAARPPRPSAGDRNLANPHANPATPPQAETLPAAQPAPRTVSKGEIPDLFARQSWYVAPPPAAPPAPTAPPLPFTYLGKFTDGVPPMVFVSSGDRNLVLHEGDVIDGTYRIDTIAPPTMSVTYLPLNETQTLEIGRSK